MSVLRRSAFLQTGATIIPDPEYVGAGAAMESYSGLSASVAKPSGTQVGDLLLTVVFSRWPNGGGIPAIDAPSGWSEAAHANAPGIGTAPFGRLQAFWRRSTGSDSFSFTKPDAAVYYFCVMLAFRNCAETGVPYDFANVGGRPPGTSSGTSVSIPGGTTLGHKRLFVGIVGFPTQVTDAVYGWANASLLSVTERLDIKSTYTGSIAIATGFKPTAGATGNMTATQRSANREGSIGLALKPIA